MKDVDIIKECKHLVSTLSEEKLTEINVLISTKKLDSKSTKLKIGSLVDLTDEEISLLKNILSNFSTIKQLPLIFELINEIKSTKEKFQEKTSLVWSGPVIFSDYAENTSTTMIKMIDSARESIILFSYVLMENTRKIFDSLIRASKRGIPIKLAFNNGEKEKGKVVKMWEKNVPLPNIYTFNPHKKGTSLHAKILIIDKKEILTTSANITSHGIHSNIEFGMRHKGKIAEDAQKLIKLLEDNHHLVKVNV